MGREVSSSDWGADYYVINGSDEVDSWILYASKAKNFASTVSLTSSSKHKVLIIDEADNTTPDVQLLLRASIEVSKELSIHLYM